MINKLLKKIQKTNPDMTAEKLISEIQYNDYLTTALIMSKGVAENVEKCYTSKQKGVERLWQ